MSEALGSLSDEALAFVSAGTPKAKPTVVAMAEPRPPTPSEVEPAEKPERAPRKREKPAEVPFVSGLVSMTFRLPAELPAALIRAASDRKLKNERPCSQQEIVAEALTQWCRKHGYLDSL